MDFLESIWCWCRRPVDQTARYGEWYTGDDSELDEQLLEYNGEHASGVSPAASDKSERRKSALPGFAAAKELRSAGSESSSRIRQTHHVRRQTIAPGQARLLTSLYEDHTIV